jgi:hypothetical protein
MSGYIKYELPERRCKICGFVIPVNGTKDDGGRIRKMGLLACERCAIDSAPLNHAPRKRRLRPGEAAEGQEIIDVPGIWIK